MSDWTSLSAMRDSTPVPPFSAAESSSIQALARDTASRHCCRWSICVSSGRESSVTTSRPHAVYQLGPRLPPLEPIAAGEIHRSQRFWVLLDQLQTAPNLAQAYSRSKELSGLSEKELRGP